MEDKNIDALEKIKRAKISILFDEPFYSGLIFSMKDILTYDVPIGATNGKVIYYNPDAIIKMKHEEIKFLIYHEIYHCILHHITRRQSRIPIIWGIAIDYVVNAILTKFSLGKMPEEAGKLIGILKDEYRDLSAEVIYNKLLEDKDFMEMIQGQISSIIIIDNNLGHNGIYDSHLDLDKEQQLETEWDIKVIAASSLIKDQGKIPSEIIRLIEKIKAPVMNWKYILLRFLRECDKSDYSWTRPNKRFVHNNIYLPSLKGRATTEIAIAVDTSGSMSEKELEDAIGEIYGILSSVNISKLHFMSIDAGKDNLPNKTLVINSWQLKSPKTVVGLLKKSLIGGGGTSFIPAFNYIKEVKNNIKVLVYLTDGMGDYPDKNEVKIPVIWVLSSNGISFERIPFGSVVRLPSTTL